MKIRDKCEADVAVSSACPWCQIMATEGTAPDPAGYFRENSCYRAVHTVNNYRRRLARAARRSAKLRA